jgi:cell division protein FtsB
MRAFRPVTLALLALLVLVQVGLWFGEGGRPQVRRLQAQLTAQQQRNAQARQENTRLTAEVQDLRQGLEMVEERARGELGMVKPDELFVQYSSARK